MPSDAKCALCLLGVSHNLRERERPVRTASSVRACGLWSRECVALVRKIGRLLRVRKDVRGTHIFAGCVRRTSETATRRVRTASAPGRHPLCSRVPAQAYRSVSRPVPESRRQNSHLTLPNDLAEPTPVLCKGASNLRPKIAIIIISLHTRVVCSAVSELHGRVRLGRSMCVREGAHRAQVFAEYGRRMRKMVENGLRARETSGVFDDTAVAGVPQR